MSVTSTPSSSTPPAKGPKQFGDGPLGVVSGGIYRWLTLTVLFAIACLPTWALTLFIAPHPSNALLFALAALPVGPALSAGLYSIRAAATDDGLTPGKAFWRGYRLNWLDVLKFWAPMLVAVGLIAWTIGFSDFAGIGTAYVIFLGIVALALFVWTMHCVAIVSFFSFRSKDVARLGVFSLLTQGRATLGVLSLLVVAAAVLLWLEFPVLLMALGGVWLWLWWRNLQSMLGQIQHRFVAH